MGPSTDCQKALGCFNRIKHGLEPSTDSQEAVGRFDRSRHGLEPSTDSIHSVHSVRSWQLQVKHGMILFTNIYCLHNKYNAIQYNFSHKQKYMTKIYYFFLLEDLVDATVETDDDGLGKFCFFSLMVAMIASLPSLKFFLVQFGLKFPSSSSGSPYFSEMGRH